MIEINQVDEIHWRLDQLEKSNINRKKEMERLDAEFDRSIEKIYDKIDRGNTLLITSLISSLLTLLIIVFMVMNK